MGSPSTHQITKLLRDWSGGDPSALDQLTPLVYEELRRLAAAYLRRERPDHTLQATALIHEAYLRLIDQKDQRWENRAHFFGIAAHLMRLILVDHARVHRAAKRGFGESPLPLEEALVMSVDRTEELLALEEALTALAAFDERKCRMIELRFFGGLGPEETAKVLGVSVPTVHRELKLAKAWLRRQLTSPEKTAEM
ncbi:MAG: sigma-70 family RNA polymerase sigma factor [Acidobacteria bacterium]|nr:sigma-70 family RNA polymerase sigma factor [Acidobacteriota bacterium]